MKNKTLDILVRGGSFNGKGAEAMLFTVRQELGKRIANARFSVELSADGYESAVEADFVPVIKKGWPSGNPLQKITTLATEVLKHPLIFGYATRQPGQLLMVQERMKSIDAVIDISGYAYGDPWAGHDFAEMSWAFTRYCQKTAKSYIFLPQAWGPFTKPNIAELTRMMCLGSRAFYARDNQSRAYLAELLDVSHDQISLSNDIAFRFRPAEPGRGAALMNHIGIRVGQQPIIGVVPNMRIYDRTEGKGVDNEYVKTLIAVVKFCRQLQTSVVILPHEIDYDAASHDDRYLCKLIVSAMPQEPDIAAVTTLESASTLKSLIGQLDLLIGSRFHSIVAGLSSRVPCVVLGWSHKYDELMCTVGLERFVRGHEKLEHEGVCELIREAWTMRRELHEQLGERLRPVEENVDELFDQVARMLQQGSA